MTKNKIIIISSIIILILAIVGIYFFFKDNPVNTQNPPQTNTTETYTENTEQNTDSTEYFDNFGLGKLKIKTFGGLSDVRTIVSKNEEYALFRNPKNIGGLEFVSSNNFGDFYFAIDANNQKIIFEKGTPEGKFGYENTLVSNKFIGDLNSQTEYYSAYPIKEVALKSGISPIENSGEGNRYLNSKYLKITNLNNNISVITQIETRSAEEDSLWVSEATRRALKLDENATGSFNLEIVDKENNSLGVVR